jgi:hypothetical protein
MDKGYILVPSSRIDEKCQKSDDKDETLIPISYTINLNGTCVENRFDAGNCQAFPLPPVKKVIPPASSGGTELTPAASQAGGSANASGGASTAGSAGASESGTLQSIPTGNGKTVDDIALETLNTEGYIKILLKHVYPNDVEVINNFGTPVIENIKNLLTGKKGTVSERLQASLADITQIINNGKGIRNQSQSNQQITRKVADTNVARNALNGLNIQFSSDNQGNLIYVADNEKYDLINQRIIQYSTPRSPL